MADVGDAVVLKTMTLVHWATYLTTLLATYPQLGKYHHFSTILADSASVIEK